MVGCTQVDVEPAGHESYDRRTACEICGLADFVKFKVLGIT